MLRLHLYPLHFICNPFELMVLDAQFNTRLYIHGECGRSDLEIQDCLLVCTKNTNSLYVCQGFNFCKYSCVCVFVCNAVAFF